MEPRFTKAGFDTTWAALGLATTKLFETLRARYAEPHRAYHTAQHIDECLSNLDLARDECERPAEVEIALWFHDAIYDPRASDNEARSADWGSKEIRSAGGSASVASSIHSLILATRHDLVPSTNDAQILTDIDLAILGARPERFNEYKSQIRQEYSSVPDQVYRRERMRILRRFVTRPSIYSVEFFRERLESQARQNIAAALARLEKG